ncbi:MAG TPA: aminopeptidase P family protein [Phycisphaerales bacterium]|nr:aminopeptidase P family protein [Phycisphaerales bacterium]
MFSAETYSQRRQTLRRRLAGQSGLLVFPGNELCPMNYADNPFPFRQDSTFLYYFGLDVPSLAAVMDLDAGTETVYGDDPTVEQVVWTGPRPALAERAARCGLTQTARREAFGQTVRNACRQGRPVHLLPPYQAQHLLALSELLEVPCAQVRRYVSEPFARAVIAMRSIKSEEEIEQIRQAIETTRQMHLAAMKTTAIGRTENEVVAAMEQVVIAHHGRMAFPVIYTIHGQFLHNHYGTNSLADGDLVINDSGAENAMHYAADITRTLPVSGRFTPRQREIYELVLSALNQSLEAVAPGVLFRDIHLAACRILAEGLKSLGLMKGNVEDAVACGAHALFFPCGLGHMLGLDVHDMEGLNEEWVGYTDTIQRSEQFGLRSLRLAKTLEPGFVLTVEPGVYFIPALIEHWEKTRQLTDYINYNKVREYLDFGGIRIEDNVLVTSNGANVLSDTIPKTVQEVEALTG